MINNIYFIIKNDQVLFDSIYENIVEETIETTRKSLDGLWIVVKLPVNIIDIPVELNGYTQYTNSEILVVLSGANWTDSGL